MAAGGSLLALGALAVALWVWSGWHELIRYQLTAEGVTFVKVVGGQVVASTSDALQLRASGRPRWLTQDRSGCSWKWGYSYTSGVDTGLNAVLTTHAIPFWPLPLFVLFIGVRLFRSGIRARRRARSGSCAKCGYNLAGLAADAPCPECGKLP